MTDEEDTAKIKEVIGHIGSHIKLLKQPGTTIQWRDTLLQEMEEKLNQLDLLINYTRR